jgi:hypothetical protein
VDVVFNAGDLAARGMEGGSKPADEEPTILKLETA